MLALISASLPSGGSSSCLSANPAPLFIALKLFVLASVSVGVTHEAVCLGFLLRLCLHVGMFDICFGSSPRIRPLPLRRLRRAGREEAGQHIGEKPSNLSGCRHPASDDPHAFSRGIIRSVPDR